MPAGTTVQSLVALFTTTGVHVTVSGVEHESGLTANDFSVPVSYVVEAADGSMFDRVLELLLGTGIVL